MRLGLLALKALMNEVCLASLLLAEMKESSCLSCPVWDVTSAQPYESSMSLWWGVSSICLHSPLRRHSESIVFAAETFSYLRSLGTGRCMTTNRCPSLNFWLAVSFWNSLTLWPLPALSCSRHQPSGSGSQFRSHCLGPWKSILGSGHHCDGIIWTTGH